MSLETSALSMCLSGYIGTFDVFVWIYRHFRCIHEDRWARRPIETHPFVHFENRILSKIVIIASILPV